MALVKIELDAFQYFLVNKRIIGVSGLNAARSLVNCKWINRKVDVKILEARDRVGGRINTKKLIPQEEGNYIFEENQKVEKKEQSTPNKRRKTEQNQFWVDLGASFIHGCNRINNVYDLMVKVKFIKQFPSFF